MARYPHLGLRLGIIVSALVKNKLRFAVIYLGRKTEPERKPPSNLFYILSTRQACANVATSKKVVENFITKGLFGRKYSHYQVNSGFEIRKLKAESHTIA